MGRKNLLDYSIEDIEHFFDSIELKSFNYTKIRDIINDNRKELNITSRRTVNSVLKYLIKKNLLFLNTIINSSNEQEQIYTWKTQDEYTVISGIKNDAYYAFYSALFLHGLTLQIPKTLYLNSERSIPLNSDGENLLTQKAIDVAFNKPQRKSKTFFKYNAKKIIITNGKYTEKLGVYPIQILKNNSTKFYYCTDLERTLIDISVRPVYSGGVFEVLEAYKSAKEKIDILLMKEYIEELNYTYPYEQIIGFYLEKAGYNNDQVQIFDVPKEYDLYLTYEIRNKLFNPKWKIYYPKGMEG